MSQLMTRQLVNDYRILVYMIEIIKTWKSYVSDKQSFFIKAGIEHGI